jgi:hypothetical protein
MKRGIVLAVIIMVTGGVASWAQTNAFKISIKGTVTEADGTKTQVKDITKGKSGLLSDTNNILVLVYSEDSNSVEIDEVDTNSNTIVSTITGSFRLAVLDSGKFNGDLEAIGPTFSGEATFGNGIPAYNGDIQADGKTVIKNGQITSVGAKLTGAWNDPLASISGNPAAVFKGTLKSSGTITVPSNCCNNF